MSKEELELHEYLKEANDRIYEQLSYAETKHAVLLGFVGAAIFAIVSIIIDLRDLNLLWLQILLGAMAFSMVIPLVISLSSFYPNLKKLRDNNLYFYGDIGKFKSAEEYLDKFNESSDLDEQLAEQNITVSSIVSSKHNKFKLALPFCIASIFPPFYTVLLIIVIIKLIKKLKDVNKRKLDLKNQQELN